MNGCVYKCEKFSDPEHNTMSWCLDGPCGDKTPSNADIIRAMSDEELATWLVYNAFKNIDAFLNDLREQANISVSYPKDEKRLFENTVKWLKEEAKDGTF